MVARTQWKVPVVVTYHGSDLMGLVNRHGEKALSSPLVVGAGRLLAPTVDAAIVQNKKMASILNNRSNVHIVPCEIDLETFRPTERAAARTALGLDPGKKYLLFAANPDIAVKRFPLAKSVAEKLAKRDPSIELLVVSKEPQNRLALFMSASDALVFTSYQEGSPNIIKQAMACNLPIVSTDVGDVRELMGNTRGCYISEADAEEFITRLDLILPACERTPGRANIQHLAGSAVARRIVEIYGQVLTNSRRKRNANRQGKSVLGKENHYEQA
jgi:glycosyltransferase involved in cell wall biosynthesis